MSQHAVELCALLVDETYGELTSRIFTILLRRGRLTIRLLQEHSQLSQRQLRHGLAVLIQQNLIYHFYEHDTKETFYEANVTAAYSLARSGKFIEIAEARYGSVGQNIVRNLLLLGQATVSNLIEACQSEKQQENGVGPSNGMNGNGHHNPFADQLEHTLSELYEVGFVEAVTSRMFRSPTDTRNEIEKTILKGSYGGSTKGTKQKEELEEIVREKLQALRDEDMEWKSKGKKRAHKGDLNGANGNSKRRRLSNGDHAQVYEGIRLDRDLLIRINYDKYIVTLRNNRLVELAYNRIGETTSHVYAEILRLMEERILRCQIDPKVDNTDDLLDGPSVTTMELAAALSPTINVATGIGKVSSDRINTSHLKIEISERKSNMKPEIYENAEEEDSEQDHDMNGNGNIPEVDEDSDSHGEDPFVDEQVGKASKQTARGTKRAKVTFDDEMPKTASSEESRLQQLKNHLLLLAADDCRFLRRCGENGKGEWTVDFENLVEHLKESEVNFILQENFGPEGHRLVRMMRKLGKVDEKMLYHAALLNQKDIRTKLAEMQMAGMVEVQCIPRDAAHTVNRSIYLWFFDADRVSSLLLNKIYKTMTRCLQRLEIERRRATGILSLAARSDVKNNETDALNGEQLNLLQNFRVKEEMLVGQIARLDDLVGIFRDY